jgi:hypothetical protein
VNQEIKASENPAAPQALITISAEGLDYQIRRRGSFETLIGERPLNLILEDCLDTGYLSQVLLTEAERSKEEQTLERITALLNGEYRLSVCREDADAQHQSDPVPFPTEQKGSELATRVELDNDSPPCYLLHLHIIPPAAIREELTFEQRVLAVRLELLEKVAALDFRGLFRGNLQAQADALKEGNEEFPSA